MGKVLLLVYIPSDEQKALLRHRSFTDEKKQHYSRGRLFYTDSDVDILDLFALLSRCISISMNEGSLSQCFLQQMRKVVWHLPVRIQEN